MHTNTNLQSDVASHKGIVGDTPLHVAAARGFVNIVKILVQCSESVDEPNKAGLTPLMLALMNAEAGTAKVLCEHGASLRIKAKDNSTPSILLELHCKHWDPDCLKLWQKPPKKEAPPPPAPRRPDLRMRKKTPAFYAKEAAKDPSLR